MSAPDVSTCIVHDRAFAYALVVSCSRNRWTKGCKQTRRMAKLLSPMHPLFSFSVRTARCHPPPLCLFRYPRQPMTSYISPTQLRQSHLYALILVHTDSRYPTKYRVRNVYLAYNVTDLRLCTPPPSIPLDFLYTILSTAISKWNIVFIHCANSILFI